MRWSCKKSGGQSSFLNTAFGDCLGLWKAVAFDENRYNQLKAKMKAGSHQSSIRRFVTARVILDAVATSEISFCRLMARMKAFSHLSSKRRFVTARVVKRAVDINEMTF